MNQPSIPVSEISRLLVNLRKTMIKGENQFMKRYLEHYFKSVRQALNLRGRSRKGI